MCDHGDVWRAVVDADGECRSAVARWVIAKYPKAWRFTIFCGKGNNGGDGFVAARKLGDQGRRATVMLLCDPAELKGDAAEMFKLMRIEPLVVKSPEELRGESMALALKGEVIIDAILGTGFRPPVTGSMPRAIKVINASRKPVVAVDIPSGADADSFNSTDDLRARADHIVTFSAPRPAHVFAGLTRGETMVAPIGSPDESIQSQLNLHVTTPRDFAALLADRSPDGHKGTYGHALVVGGSVGKSGAVAMAGMSVLRSGAGLSTIATAKSALPMVAAFHAGDHDRAAGGNGRRRRFRQESYRQERIAQVMEGKDVVALGPGIGRHAATVFFVQHFVEDCKVPLVIDADGLNAFAGQTEKLNGATRSLVLDAAPGRDVATDGTVDGRCTERQNRSRAEVCRRASMYRGLEGTSHIDCAAGWNSLGQHDWESRYGDGRHR